MEIENTHHIEHIEVLNTLFNSMTVTLEELRERLDQSDLDIKNKLDDLIRRGLVYRFAEGYRKHYYDDWPEMEKHEKDRTKPLRKPGTIEVGDTFTIHCLDGDYIRMRNDNGDEFWLLKEGSTYLVPIRMHRPKE